MNSLEEEIEVAKDIAFLDEKPDYLRWLFTGNYNEYSFIFRVTNERINTKEYMDVIKDKNKILSVIGSGDQILNSILLGSKDIDGFDISIFPKYYLKLKMAALESLDLKDYKNFFYGRNALNSNTYRFLSDKLDENSKKFWDSLINYRDLIKRKRLATSDLFCTDLSCIMMAEENNPYMEPNNYKELKSKIKNINLRLFQGDIFNIRNEIPDSYDLVNLSSIIVAGQLIPPSFEEQKEIFKGFKLNKGGEILSYIFDIDYDTYFEGWKEIPNDDDFKCSFLHNEKGEKEDAILVYRKI